VKLLPGIAVVLVLLGLSSGLSALQPCPYPSTSIAARFSTIDRFTPFQCRVGPSPVRNPSACATTRSKAGSGCFLTGMRGIFPDRPIEDLENRDEIPQVRYDLDDRFQVPGEQSIRTGRTYEKDGYFAKWRSIRDDKGRVIVAICHNMHLGDAWEWADSPAYPEKFASMAFRVGLNYIMYGMTH
jgi:hypothetical protein